MLPENDIYAWRASGPVARVAEPGTATEPVRLGALGVEPRDRKKLDQVSCWSFGPRGFKSHPGRLPIPHHKSRNRAAGDVEEARISTFPFSGFGASQRTLLDIVRFVGRQARDAEYSLL